MEKEFANIEDLLSDPSFRSWVTDSTPELDRYWLAWLQENQDKQDMVDQAKALIAGLTFKEFKPDPESKARIFAEVKAKQEVRDLWQNTPFEGRRWLRIAAVVLVLLATTALLVYLNAPKSKEIAQLDEGNYLEFRTEEAQRRTYSLPDGSKVSINSGSSLRYPENFRSDSRVVELRGEAFFEVVSDSQRPFRVVSERVEVVVLGTKFNLNAKQDQPSVALVEGKVRLEAKSTDQSLELSPNQMATYTADGEFTLSTFDAKVVAGWKDGYLMFREASLENVVDKLHNWYGANIRVINQDAVSDWSYTGTFRNESLENVLLNMSTLRPFEYQIQQDSLILSF